MARDYQYNYSELKPSVFNATKRERKANTMVRVCRDYCGEQGVDIENLTLLDVGSSSGIIDNYLADHFGEVHGIDIDETGMRHARETFTKQNLFFAAGDAMALTQQDNSIDVIVCSQVYEHVPDAAQMFTEIHRVLRPGGFCYFAGNNRLMYMEPHYQLPLLSVIPRPLAHYYLRMAGKGDYYHEKHFSYWGLRRLCRDFHIVDYSRKVIAEPERFGADYMLKPGSTRQRLANIVASTMPWLAPHIWLLQKPATTAPAG